MVRSLAFELGRWARVSGEQVRATKIMNIQYDQAVLAVSNDQAQSSATQKALNLHLRASRQLSTEPAGLMPTACAREWS